MEVDIVRLDVVKAHDVEFQCFFRDKVLRR